MPSDSESSDTERGSDAALEALIAQQRQCIAAVERTLPNFKKMGKAKMTLAVTKQRLGALETLFLQCRNLDCKIHAKSTVDQRIQHKYFKDHEFLKCEESYQTAADYMAEIIQKETPPPASPENVSQLCQSLIESTHRPATHLPRVNLPSFSGTFSEWESFRDRFTSMIVNDKSLDDVERLHYLISSLKGDALKSLNHLKITTANFKVAWDLLEARYENTRRLVFSHLTTLFNLPQFSTESAKDLRDLRDKTNTSISALRNLGRSVDEWDDVLVFLVSQKLDRASRKAWESHLGRRVDVPKYAELDDFLQSRVRALESITPIEVPVDKSKRHFDQSKSRTFPAHSTTANTTNNIVCPICKASHLLYQCQAFLNQTPTQRYDFIKEGKRCINCFSLKHAITACTNPKSCRQCHKRHNTLLHFPENPDRVHVGTSVENPSITLPPNEASLATHCLAGSVASHTGILLATAHVILSSPQGRSTRVRALIDPGSVTNLITEKIAQDLRLAKDKYSATVTGVGGAKTPIRQSTSLTVTPTTANEPSYPITALIIKTLMQYMPTRTNVQPTWPHVAGLTLADADPMSAEPIDILIGGELYSKIIREGVRSGSDNEPLAQNTIFGWILTGPVGPSSSTHSSPVIHVHHQGLLETLDDDFCRFWEIETIPQKTHLTPEDEQCEVHFEKTHSRLPDGRYMVRLPFKNGPPINLGESHTVAVQNLAHTERRFQRDSDLADSYRSFMTEYKSIGHMIKASPFPKSCSNQVYYIPHHAVVRENSSTTRLRVVFNASSRSSNGSSLNDHMLIGQKLQTEPAVILTKWRFHRYVYTADISKMYRRILVHPDDVDYQRILWRGSTSDPLAEYQLLTVTYGTASAPYLALRVLKQLAHDEGHQFPLVLPVLLEQFFVDDCLFGADDRQIAIAMRQQLTSLLEKGHFRLRKWASNCPSLLADVDPSDHGLAEPKEMNPQDSKNSFKILGIAWDSHQDLFRFRVNRSSLPGNTKRAVLSNIAKLFDPSGWVTPVVVTAKVLMQQLWLRKCGWDEPLPSDVLTQWHQYHENLPWLEKLTIPRWTTYGSDTENIEIHGFADASTAAYAAAVYVRQTSLSGTNHVTLLAAKSLVAPLKTLSVPRLEISAALLLARLISYIRKTLPTPNVKCFCWTDSTITLAWISQPPSRWRTFVANRVATIQTLLPEATWCHVPTRDNPADCASRGLSAPELLQFDLWWSGPPWLKTFELPHPTEPLEIPSGTFLEEKRTKIVCAVNTHPKWDLSDRYSSWPKLLRVTGYILRFVNRLRRKPLLPAENPPDCDGTVIPEALQASEIQTAKLNWLKTIQRDLFPEELNTLHTGTPVKKGSSLASLNPYLDDTGLIRVGGRLRHAHMPESAKHPIVLKSHPLLNSIISYTHSRNLHAGPTLTLAILREEFWILRARATVRAVLYRCTTCCRENAKIPQQLMGDLPDFRVQRTSRAFVHVGVDYAGPILVRPRSGRGSKSYKTYISLFICMTTKAVHIELVDGYTSASFLAAFCRFTSRRGLPSHVYSDNGTTFQGANQEIQEAYRNATLDPNFINRLASEKIAWHFIPPAAPHFGGLWEVGVRSVKYYLKRCSGAHKLSFEEMATLLCRIESCMHSRPISAMSDCIDDYQALIPGHFLIGAPLRAPPEPSVLGLNENRLSRWQLVQRISEGFWQSWSKDYLQALQQRPKWRTVQTLATNGQLVLLRNHLNPPSQWELGRIIACYPGDDGLVRVVKVKTARSEYIRPIVKLCFLHIDINNNTTDRDSVLAGGEHA